MYSTSLKFSSFAYLVPLVFLSCICFVFIKSNIYEYICPILGLTQIYIKLGVSIGPKPARPDPSPTHPETDIVENPNRLPTRFNPESRTELSKARFCVGLCCFLCVARFSPDSRPDPSPDIEQNPSRVPTRVRSVSVGRFFSVFQFRSVLLTPKMLHAFFQTSFIIKMLMLNANCSKTHLKVVFQAYP